MFPTLPPRSVVDPVSRNVPYYHGTSSLLPLWVRGGAGQRFSRTHALRPTSPPHEGRTESIRRFPMERRTSSPPSVSKARNCNPNGWVFWDSCVGLPPAVPECSPCASSSAPQHFRLWRPRPEAL